MVARASAIAASAAVLATALAFALYRSLTDGGGDYGEIYFLVILAAVCCVGALYTIIDAIRGRSSLLSMFLLTGSATVVLALLGVAVGLRG